MSGSLKFWDGTQWLYVAQAGPPGEDGSAITPAELLAKLITVDGSGSGLDADLLDGVNGDAYAVRTGPGQLLIDRDGGTSIATPAGAALEVNDARTYMQDADGAFLAADSGEIDLASASGPGWHVDDPSGTLRPLHDANNDVGTALRRVRNVYLSGTVNLAGTPLGDAATKNVGTTAGTVAAGDAVPLKVNNLSDMPDAGSMRWNLSEPVLGTVIAVATSNVASLSGTGATVDGITLAAGDRVLLVAQTTGTQNGVWVVASGAWSRPTDYRSGGAIGGRLVQVRAGTVYAHTVWETGTQIASTIDTNTFTWRIVGGHAAPVAHRAGATAKVNITGGDISVAVTSWAALTTTNDLTLGNATVLPLSAGMWVEVSLLGFSGSATPGLYLDVATMVSGSAVNFVSGLANASNTSTGVQGWRCGGTTNANFSGTVPYQLQAGDISASTVTLRPYAVLSAAGSRSVLANANAPLVFAARVI